MSQRYSIRLEIAAPEDYPAWMRRLQEAFTPAAAQYYGVCEPVPSEESVRHSLHAAGADVYHIVLDGRRVGGAVVIADRTTGRSTLELFFLAPDCHGRGIGLAAWRAIEARYPHTAVWQTITPYFEQRNIHFYINKCGFHIVEFFNAHHVDPALPRPDAGTDAPAPGMDAYFLFEKTMRPSARAHGR